MRSLLLLFALSTATACTSWHSAIVETGVSRATQRDRIVAGDRAVTGDRRGVRVRTTQGQDLRFEVAVLRADTVFGVTGSDTRAVPYSDVARLDVRRGPSIGNAVGLATALYTFQLVRNHVRR